MVERMGVHTFLKGITSKVNPIAWLEFELAYYNVAVQHVSNNAMVTPSHKIDTAIRKD